MERRERVFALEFSLLSERKGKGNGARDFLYCSLEVLCGEVGGCRECCVDQISTNHWVNFLLVFIEISKFIFDFQYNEIMIYW